MDEGSLYSQGRGWRDVGRVWHKLNQTSECHLISFAGVRFRLARPARGHFSRTRLNSWEFQRVKDRKARKHGRSIVSL